VRPRLGRRSGNRRHNRSTTSTIDLEIGTNERNDCAWGDGKRKVENGETTPVPKPKITPTLRGAYGAPVRQSGLVLLLGGIRARISVRVPSTSAGV
jgi:hypothetical protein